MLLTPETFLEIFERAVSVGLSLPFHIVAVSSDGQVLAAAMESEGQPPRLLCSHTTGTDFRLPINIYISDSTGNAIRALLEASSATPVWMN